jgi:predicted RNA polymerase sigma factor
MIVRLLYSDDRKEASPDKLREDLREELLRLATLLIELMKDRYLQYSYACMSVCVFVFVLYE